MKICYRPDIDGLRAIAIIAVLLFHLAPNWFKGGFLGVDIFFVISGFLITQLILTEISSGYFSIINRDSTSNKIAKKQSSIQKCRLAREKSVI